MSSPEKKNVAQSDEGKESTYCKHEFVEMIYFIYTRRDLKTDEIYRAEANARKKLGDIGAVSDNRTREELSKQVHDLTDVICREGHAFDNQLDVVLNRLDNDIENLWNAFKGYMGKVDQRTAMTRKLEEKSRA